MNRIILIGNGFDLAHGLKTSYADFIDWYWGEWGKRLLRGQSKIEEDRFCSFKLNDATNLFMWCYVWNGYYYKRENPWIPWDEHQVVELAKQDSNLCSFSIKSGLFSEICKDVATKGWVDIENVYYSYLRSGIIPPNIINDELEYLKKRLIEYLLNVQKGITEDLCKRDITNKIMEPFKKRDFAINAQTQFPEIQMNSYDMDIGKMHPDRSLLLDFNYTATVDLYFPKPITFVINHIHGDLSNPNSVIFGYGDELDSNYKILSEKNDNEYLRNIKSIKYLESPNYRNLLEFMESAPYQVFIMGHSCGNSDRTLLNTLFEHKNCVSIKPFYYIKPDGTDNYMELVQNISRNFTDMKLMRDRVVNKTFCESYSDSFNNQVYK